MCSQQTSLDLVTTFIPTCKHTLAFPSTDLVSTTTFEHTQLSQDSFEWRCLHLHTFAHAFPTSVNIEPNLHMLTYICMSHNTLVHDSFQKVVTQCAGCIFGHPMCRMHFRSPNVQDTSLIHTVVHTVYKMATVVLKWPPTLALVPAF